MWIDARILFHLGTSKAPIGSSNGAGVHVPGEPRGLKDILRCLLSGLASRLHGPSYSSVVVTLCVKDMVDGYPAPPCMVVVLRYSGNRRCV